MSKRAKIQTIYELFVDLFVLIISNLAAYAICESTKKIPEISNEDYISYIFIILVSFCTVFLGFTSSLNLSRQNRLNEFISVLRNCLLTYMILAVLLIFTKNKLIQSRYLFVISLCLFIATSSIGRYILKHALMHNFEKSKMCTLVGVITVSERAEDFLNELSQDWSRKIVGIALLDAVEENGVYKCSVTKKKANENGTLSVTEKNLEISDFSGIPIVADNYNFMDWIRKNALDEVFINIPYGDEANALPYIEELEDMGITVHINLATLENIVDTSEYNTMTCGIIAEYPMATLKAKDHNKNHLVLKRFGDILGGLVGTVISAPIIMVTAIPLLIESPGPLIFKQKRIGKNGRTFYIYKLRSMYVDAEERKKELMKKNKMDGLMFKMDDDPRITKVGKFIRKTSIDELPQFWNVLKGDMSLVGTRPPTVDEFEKYESHHKRRLSMRPGITGMWQVSGRSDITDFEEVVKLDCKYIDNWSLLFDAKILIKTIDVVLRHKGAE